MDWLRSTFDLLYRQIKSNLVGPQDHPQELRSTFSRPLDHIDVSLLPDVEVKERDFVDSFFFKKHGTLSHLPHPSHVKAQREPSTPQPEPVKYEDLNLIVKFGPHVTIEEGLCLWAIKHSLQDAIPVPELYGWRIHEGTVFIYMELIKGITLADRWDILDVDARRIICGQLQKSLSSLRSLRQEPTNAFLGMPIAQPSQRRHL